MNALINQIYKLIFLSNANLIRTCKNVSKLLIVRLVCVILGQNKVMYILFYFIIIHNILNYFVDPKTLHFILKKSQNPNSIRQDYKQNLVSRTECCDSALNIF